MMRLKFWINTCRLLLIGLVLTSAVGQSWAALGQAPSAGAVPVSPSLAAGAKAQAAGRNVGVNRFTVHQTRLESGTTVMEYATPAGLVFAVSWRGPVLPDLSALLGVYFNTFKLETDKVRLAGRRGSSVKIERDGLIISSNGRMRDFFGYAYAPGLMPAGLDIKNVLP